MAEFIQLLFLGVLVGLIYALVALGMVLIFRASGVLNFAQGQFVMLGAMIIWALMAQLQLPVWAVFPLAIACMWGLAWVVERLTIHPLVGQPVLAIIIMTLGLAVILESVAALIWGTEGRGYPVKLLPTGTMHFGAIGLPELQVYSLVAVGVIFGALLFYLTRSRQGLAMQAIADDQQAAQAVGVSVRGILSLSWVIAGLVGMVGGYFLGNMIGIEIAAMPQFGLKAIAVMLFGGLQSIPGVMIAGPIIGICEYLTSGYLDPIVGGGLKDVFPFVILVLVLVFRPQGLFGWKIIERV